MPPSDTAKVFVTGRSQAVLLPKAYRFEGKEVRISRTPNGGVLLEPLVLDEQTARKKADALRASLRRISGGVYDVELPSDPPLPDEDTEWPAL
jgi:antitoxin VapB